MKAETGNVLGQYFTVTYNDDETMKVVDRNPTLKEAREEIGQLGDGSYWILKLCNSTPYEVKRVTEVKVSGGERRKRGE